MTRTRGNALAMLRAAMSSEHEPSGVSLGMSMLTCSSIEPDDSTPTIATDDTDVTRVYDSRQRQLYECAARARDRLAAVRPALARLRDLLPRPCDARDRRCAESIDLAIADVERGLVHSRRSVRALAAELAELESESRDLVAIASRFTEGQR